MTPKGWAYLVHDDVCIDILILILNLVANNYMQLAVNIDDVTVMFLSLDKTFMLMYATKASTLLD